MNGDAFSDQIKADVIAKIKVDLGKIDLVIYSLASPRRTDPETGEVFKSTLKPVGQAYKTKTYDTDKDLVHEISPAPAPYTHPRPHETKAKLVCRLLL